MAQITDLDAVVREGVKRVLAAAADHLTEIHPTAALDPEGWLVIISAEAHKLTGTSRDASLLAQAALDTAPASNAGTTRGEYALILRRAAFGGASEWGDDANEPVIPTVPGQRPAPAEDAASDAPQCCGRPMRCDGQQWVCSKCKSWVDLGGSAGVGR